MAVGAFGRCIRVWKDSWPIFIPGHSFDGQVATFDSSRVICPRPSRIDEPGGGVDEQAESSERGLAFDPRNDVVGEADCLKRRAEHELAGVQDERLAVADLDRLHEVRRLIERVDDLARVVAKYEERIAESDIDTRGLDLLRVERLDDEAAVLDLLADAPVGQNHAPRLPVQSPLGAQTRESQVANPVMLGLPVPKSRG